LAELKIPGTPEALLEDGTTRDGATMQPRLNRQHLASVYEFDPERRYWHRAAESSESKPLTLDAGDQQIHEILVESRDVTLWSSELRTRIVDASTRYHLSPERANLLRPVVELLRGKTLELGAECGALTRFLGELGGVVVAVEENPSSATIAAVRCRDLSNVTIVQDHIDRFKSDETFDAILVIGTIDRWPAGLDALTAFVESLKPLLAESGVLIFAAYNALSLKHLAFGLDSATRMASVLKKTPEPGFGPGLGRIDIERLLTDCGFSCWECLLPFPDYRLPVTLLLPEGYRNRDVNLATFLLNSTLSGDRSESQLISVENLWRTVERNQLVPDLANSFLYVAREAPSQFPLGAMNKGVFARHYATNRRPQFCKETILLENEGFSVQHQPLSSAHDRVEVPIRPVWTDESFIPGEVWSDRLHAIVNQSGWRLADVVAWADPWVRKLEGPENSGSRAHGKRMHQAVTGNYLDATPFNLIHDREGVFKWIDLEWETIPQPELGLILFRGLLWSFSRLNSVAQPAEGTTLNVHEIICSILQHLGYWFATSDIERYLQMENDLQKWVSVKPTQIAFQEYLSIRLYERPPLRDLTRFSSDINSLKSELWERDQSLRTLVNQVTERTAEITALQSELAERDRSIAELGTKLTELNHVLQDREQMNSALKLQVQVKDQAITSLENAVADRKTESDRKEDKISSLSIQLRELEHKFTTFSALISEREQYVSGLEARLMAQQRRIAEVEGELGQEKQSASIVSARFAQQENENLDLRNGLDDIQHSLSWRITMPFRWFGKKGKALIWQVCLTTLLQIRRAFGDQQLARFLTLAPFIDASFFLTCSPNGRCDTQFEGAFDASYYARRYPDAVAAKVNLLAHYVAFGAAEGRDPNPLFQTDFYVAQLTGDSSRINPLAHYLWTGSRENLDPHPLFNSSLYLEGNPDVAKSGCNPLIHYLAFGGAEGRCPHVLFDPQYYLRQYVDVARAQVAPLAHYLECGATEGRFPNPLFDSGYYLRENPDVSNAKLNPLEHYLRWGASEGRKPNWIFDSAFYLAKYPDVKAAGMNPLAHYLSYGAAEGRDPGLRFCTSFYLSWNPDLKTQGINPLAHYLTAGAAEGRICTATQSVELKENELRTTLRLEKELRALSIHPLISVLIPTFNSDPRYLRKAIDSVLSQVYPKWEICVCDDGSSSADTLDVLDSYARRDSRIRIARHSTNQGIASATNTALGMADGEFVAMLDHDDEITSDALLEIVKGINENPEIDVLYTDQDYVEPDGTRVLLFHKPDWSLDLFRGVMYIGHLLVVRRELAKEVRFDSAFDKIQDFEFMLRLVERTQRIVHIPRVLYHWRRIPGSIAAGANEKSNIEPLQAAAVNAHFSRLGVAAVARSNATLPHRLKIEPKPRSFYPKVSLIFEAPDGFSPEGDVLTAILNGTNYPNLEVVIAGGRAAWHEQVNRPVVPIVWCEPNGGSPSTVAGNRASGDYLVWITQDLCVETPEWIEHLLLYTEMPDVGCVSPLVLDDNGLVQHAGLIIGLDGVIGEAMRGRHPAEDGYAGSLGCTREVTAVSAEGMMVTRRLFLDLGGFERHYSGPLFRGADLSLRAGRSGKRNICNPRAVLRRRIKSSAAVAAREQLDRDLLLDTWSDLIAKGDHFHNPNFILTGSGFDDRALL
jgi:O-antigen biosynthesis protein